MAMLRVTHEKCAFNQKYPKNRNKTGKAISLEIIYLYKFRVRSLLLGDSMKADTMVWSDFESDHAFTVKLSV